MLLGPAAGDQACGEVGDGRMLEAAELRDELIAFFQPKLLAGRTLLLTAGPTFEAIDPVRGISNHSSGKMGFAIARAAAEAGAQVTLVAGPVHLPTPRGVRRIDVQSAQQMFDAVLPLAPRINSSSPPLPWPTGAPWRRPCRRSRRTAAARCPALDLTENPDILAAVAAPARRPSAPGAWASRPRANTSLNTRAPNASARACR